MSPIFDFYCECGNEKTDVWCRADEGVICSECFKPMKRACNCHSFKLVYDNKKDMCSWGNEGYASSQYWNDVKAARERGEKVKGVTEN